MLHSPSGIAYWSRSQVEGETSLQERLRCTPNLAVEANVEVYFPQDRRSCTGDTIRAGKGTTCPRPNYIEEYLDAYFPSGQPGRSARCCALRSHPVRVSVV